MRKLTVIVLVLAALWSGYWFAGSAALRSGAEQWFADQTALGITAEKTALSVTGFPNRFDLTVEGLSLADPQTGTGWSAPFAQIFAMTWKPWHVIAALPPTQTVRLPGQDIGITSERLMASARVQPTPSVPLAEIILDGAALSATSTEGWTLGATSLLFAVRADPVSATAYDIALTAKDIAPDPAFLATLGPTSTLPPLVAEARATLNARLTAPLDRNAGTTNPTLIGLEVKDVLVKWGTMSITAKGLIQPDSDGYAAGRIAIDIANWQQLIPLLIATGAVSDQFAPTVQNMLKAMADAGGNPDILSLPLTLAKGRMSLGPLPLGAAPLLVPPTN